ncbi:MAG TPA: c-type cytochrome [Sphingomicrobium sp.]|nr:c-type cytochrome [Sphingomicrobium sp.]
MAQRLAAGAAVVLMGSGAFAAVLDAGQHATSSSRTESSCRSDAGLSLPPGFCATVFADNLGHARHLVVSDDGTVYVNTWQMRKNSPVPAGGFLVALRDVDGDGRADQISRFGPGADQGNSGGTGIALYKGALYAEANDKIVRYALAAREPVPQSEPAVILSGMPLTGDHPMHPFAIDAGGHLFVNSGSATNSCELHNRQPGSKGTEPCAELETRAGIWRYDANRAGQTFSPAERFATGIRNAGGITFDASGRMFATQHGRDQLSENWPALYRPQQGPELPAEELIAPVQGGDFGWPRCYYDGFQRKLVLSPEYGGDGGKTVGVCAHKVAPIAAFPAHWAPNDVLIYRGTQFPSAYRGGAFIAFHGSWNRAPAPQGGYEIVFQPIAAGKASGPYIRFADGFAGAFKEPGRAEHRPAGLAVGPDGSLYIADDVRGRIWKVSYRGDLAAPLKAAAAARSSAPVHPASSLRASSSSARMNTPPRYTAAQVALGDRIFHGETRGGTCSGCHGSDAKGTPVGPKLTGPDWLWANGSVGSIARIISEGVTKPKKYNAPMPPRGGAPLSASDVNALAAYVWTLGHPSR